VLARKLPREGRVTLIDQNNFLLFTPMLIEVLAGQVDMLHIVAAARQLHRRIKFEQGRVVNIDLTNKRVDYLVWGGGGGNHHTTRSIQADHIVIALGSAPDFRGVPGLEANAMTMKNLCDAVSIHNRALALLERADSEPDARVRRRLLTFVIGGGGFSGVETTAALTDFVMDAMRYYPTVQREDIRVVLVEMESRLLPELDERLVEYARHKLERMGVEVRLNTAISHVAPDYVDFASGERVYGHTLIWTGGISPVAVVRRMACECTKQGAIIADSTCAIDGFPGCWALGDCAHVPHPRTGIPYAPTAQNAVRQGRLVANNIIATLNGKPVKPFNFKAIGEAAALGRHAGIASIYGVRFWGFPAWFLWRTIYLLKLPRLKQRVRVGIDWAMDLVFGREIVELPAQCFVAGLCPTIELQETNRH
jgi:NADH dehydrogenase